MQFAFYSTRNTKYYVVKILMIVFFLNVISWGTFFMVNDPREQEETLVPAPAPEGEASAGSVRRMLKSKGGEANEDAPFMHIGAERFSERLSLSGESFSRLATEQLATSDMT